MVNALDTADVRPIRVQLSVDGILPYEENQPGDVLATFSDSVFGSWIRLDSPGQYSSDLVDYQFSEDLRKLTLTIHLGAKFHNGRTIHADDIHFSILRGLYLDQASFYAGFLGCIEGISETTRLSPNQGVAGVIVKSQRAVELHFKRPCPEIVHALSLPYVAPRPREELGMDLIHFRHLPIGAGPYRVVGENQEQGQISLVKVSELKPGPTRVIFLTKKQSAYPDVLLSRAANLKGPDFISSSSTSPGTTMTLFSSGTHPLFQLPGLRALFYSAFDRDGLVADESEEVALSVSLYGSKNPVTAAQRQEVRHRLKHLLKTWNRPLKIATFGSAADARKQTAIRNLTAQFAEIGLQVEFEFLTQKFLTEEDRGKFAFWLANLVIDPLAPGTMLSSFRKSSAFVFHRVADPQLEPLFENWERAATEQEKLQTAIALDDFISSGGFGIPLLRGHNTIYFNPATIHTLGEQVQMLAIDLTKIGKSCNGLLGH